MIRFLQYYTFISLTSAQAHKTELTENLSSSSNSTNVKPTS